MRTVQTSSVCLSSFVRLAASLTSNDKILLLRFLASAVTRCRESVENDISNI